jgi:ectoine hydroxylase-related dioxygenase (phytanoyl-CoA dioxygenase family)
VYAKCERAAEALLERRAYYLFDHAIYKMPRSGAATPWHQDQAYLGKSAGIQSVHFWIPLQDTDATNGCLRFVPHSHEAELQPHVSAYAANPHVLRTCSDYSGRAVAVPLRKGDMSIHTNLTIHSSGANESNTVRKAWIIHFGDRPLWYKRMLQLKDLAAPGRRITGQ